MSRYSRPGNIHSKLPTVEFSAKCSEHKYYKCMAKKNYKMKPSFIVILLLENTKQAVTELLRRLWIQSVKEMHAYIRDLITDSVNNATMQLL